MTKTIDTKEYIDALLALIEDGSTEVPLPIKGDSMRPFLREGDTVFLSALEKKPKRGDVVLFLRRDRSYVLHRVVRRLSDGTYLILGDGQYLLEPVDEKDIVALAKSARRKGKLIKKSSPVWFFYRTLWLYVRRLRPLIGKLWHTFKKT